MLNLCTTPTERNAKSKPKPLRKSAAHASKADICHVTKTGHLDVLLTAVSYSLQSAGARMSAMENVTRTSAVGRSEPLTEPTE